jgi:hypothetical protein
MKGMTMDTELIIEEIEKILAQIDNLNNSMKRMIGE